MSLTWRWLRVLVPAATFLPLITACPARPLEDPVDTPRVQDNRYFPQAIEKDVDLLFMVDNSNSMQEKQTNLAANFPRFIEALRSYKLGSVTPGATNCTQTNTSGCKIPNVRIGVVSSDLGAGQYTFATCMTPGGDRGVLHNSQSQGATPGCPLPKDKWISYTESNGQIVTNVQGSTSTDPVQQVKDAFSCIAQLGIGGCGFEFQLESAKRALDGCQVVNGTTNCKVNPGFIRPDAFLAIVFITDEDDCSARRGELFDPTQQGLNDPLGPLNSFRCTEFGWICDQKGTEMRQPGIKTNCVPGLDYLYPVDGYTDFFKSLKPAGRVILFAIAGPLTPVEVGLESSNPTLKYSCNSQAVGGQGGVPAIRIASVVKSFGDHGHFNEGISGNNPVTVDICSPDFTPALQLLGRVIVASLGGQCISAPPLTKSGAIACNAGDDLGGMKCAASCLDKVDCSITEKVGEGPETPVKECPSNLFDPSIKQNECGADCPCWRIVPTPECVGSRDGSPYGLQIMRTGEAQKGTVAVAKCATALFAWGTTEFSNLPQCK